MSRAYRITVKESETRRLRGSDEIGTCLELLEILPPEAMAGLLKRELAERGFEEQDNGTMVRIEGSLTVTVDPCNGDVLVKAERAEDVTLEARQDATGFDDAGPNQKTIRERIRSELQQDIDKRAEKEQERLQSEATEALERHLDELQPELAKIVNKVTRDALKEKAAQLGSIKEIAEDPESGNLTIKIEV